MERPRQSIIRWSAPIPPYWLRMTRVGNLFTAYTSSDGVNWTLLGSITVTMGATVDVGLAVTSHNTASLNTSTFQNVSIVPTPYVVAAANASPSPVTGTTANLSALGNENGSPSGLTYTWAATAKPSGSNPVFSVNGTSAAQNTSVTFDTAGVYTFQVTISDSASAFNDQQCQRDGESNADERQRFPTDRQPDQRTNTKLLRYSPRSIWRPTDDTT